MGYETKLEDGTIITSYLACAYAEGFCEGESASIKDNIKAWSYIAGTGMWMSLQGFYGRTVNNLINDNVIDNEGCVNWDRFNELSNNI